MLNPLLDPNKQSRNKSLFGDYGFDPSGNNELGAIFRRSSMGLFPRLASQIQFGNGLETMRQGFLSDLLSRYSNQGQMAGADQMRTQFMGQVPGQQNRIRGAFGDSPGIGAMQGAQVSAINGANRSANDYLSHLASPEGQQALSSLFGSAVHEGQGLGALSPELSMFGPIEGRNRQNQAEQGGGILNGLLGLAGSAIGGGGMNLGSLSRLFGGGHGNDWQSSSPGPGGSYDWGPS